MHTSGASKWGAVGYSLPPPGIAVVVNGGSRRRNAAGDGVVAGAGRRGLIVSGVVVMNEIGGEGGAMHRH